MAESVGQHAMDVGEDGTPLIVVISGPSGVGKDTIIERMAELGHTFHFTITATTRKPRPNEEDGVNHHFLTQEHFIALIDSDELLEWALVYGNYYGVPKRQVRDALDAGSHVIVRVDVQGALRIKEIVPDALLLFINAPNTKVLRDRLVRRGVNTEEDMRLRLAAAESETEKADIFDYQIVNHENQLDDAVDEITTIVKSEARRYPPRVMNI